MKTIEYRAGLYLRLSNDDLREGRESSSIENQRLILTKYAEDHGWNIIKTYIEMITTSLIQFNYSSRNFILGCISWVHKILLPKEKCTQMHPNHEKPR